MINNLSIIGRLARDPELRETQTGQTVCNFTLVVPKRIKMLEGPSSDFIPVVAYGNQARYVGEYLTKGRLVGVEGRLESRTIKDAAGQSRDILEVIAQTVDGLDRPREESTARNEELATR